MLVDDEESLPKTRRNRVVESLLIFVFALLVGFVGGLRGWW